MWQVTMNRAFLLKKMQQFNVTISIFNIIRGRLGITAAEDSVCNDEMQGGDWCNLNTVHYKNSAFLFKKMQQLMLQYLNSI
jgi:hypothetical protein